MKNDEVLVKKKILIVDDQEINRSILKRLLIGEYDILEAENGQVALDILNDASESISLILLDIVMPIMDGYTFLKLAKNDPHISQIPIIVVTQQDNKESEISALSAGATDFLSKPYKPDIVRFRVKSLIRFYEAVSLTTVIERDKTTELYTREAFFSYVKKQMDLYPNKEWSILCFSLININQIADLFGEGAANQLLFDTSLKIRRVSEKYGSILGRVWNDTIAIALPSTSISECSDDLNDVLSYVHKYPLSIKINIKAGLCVVDNKNVPIRTYCDRAKTALESIENSYYVNLAVYDKVLDEKLKFENRLILEAEKAVEEDQFKVYFQPKVNLLTGEILSAEALVRWQHPMDGLLSPDKFIPLFEHNGFITEIDLYVFKKACECVKEWIDEELGAINVSINISRTDLLNENLPEMLLSCVDEYNLKTSFLHLEITETSFVNETEQIYNMISRLRTLGFVIEMDDFGSGYSSLSMLNSAPIDILKLDIQFLKNRRKNQSDDRIFPLMARLSSDLNLPVIVEGVETLDDVDYLLSHAFKYGQGYYYSKPVPAEDFKEILKSSKITTMGVFEKCSHPISPEDLYNFINGLPFGIMFCSGENRIEFINDSLLGFLGKHNKYSFITDLLTEESKNSLLNVQKKCMDFNSTSEAAIPFELADKSAATRKLLVYVRKVLIDGLVHWQITTLNRMSVDSENNNMDELNALINRMRAEASFDKLTHVYQRHYFRELVNNELATAKSTCAFIYIDIDNFKSINDTMGHQKGDLILDNFGKKLNAEFRNADISARMGGDEFAIFLKDIPNPLLVKKRMTKICDDLNNELGITCSVGIALYPQHGKTFEELYKVADKAMYKVKTEGKAGCLISK